MSHIYSPKISEDLIPVLYRIGKREGKPMTKVVDGFLRDAISTYISHSKVSDVTEDSFLYKPAPKRRRLKTPSIGQSVQMPYGTGEVTDVKYWKDIENNVPEGEEKMALRDRTEFFLGDVNRYFEYTVRFKEGDSATFDWSEYENNFNKKR